MGMVAVFPERAVKAKTEMKLIEKNQIGGREQSSNPRVVANWIVNSKIVMKARFRKCLM